jgi:hypothetical protein
MAALPNTAIRGAQLRACAGREICWVCAALVVAAIGPGVNMKQLDRFRP